jgi:hypothetical protein
MGHAMITCTACHDQLRQTTFYEPAHDKRARRPHRLGDSCGSPALSASATTGSATATACGPVVAATLTAPSGHRHVPEGDLIVVTAITVRIPSAECCECAAR